MNLNEWINALLGGVLIGLASALFLLINGRIAGISGVINHLFFAQDRLWPALFILGLVAGAALNYALTGTAPTARTNFPVGLLIVAGVLVGYGTGLARGCTSGHGVSGLGQRSLRSLVATLTFLSAGMVSTFVVRHLLGVGL